MKKITDPTAADTIIGDRILLLRKVRGWDQAQLSEVLETHGLKMQATTISRTENGKRSISSAEIEGMAKAFGVRPLDLIRGTQGAVPKVTPFDRLPVPELHLRPVEPRFTEYDLPGVDSSGPSDLRALADAIESLADAVRGATGLGVIAA